MDKPVKVSLIKTLEVSTLEIYANLKLHYELGRYYVRASLIPLLSLSGEEKTALIEAVEAVGSKTDSCAR